MRLPQLFARVLVAGCLLMGNALPASACSQAPLHPPIVIVPGQKTPDGQTFWVTFRNYTTFGASSGQFCACGLALGDPNVTVLAAALLDSTTGHPLPGFSFTPNANVGPSFNNFSVAAWTGFLSNVTASIPAGIGISLQFCILVPVSGFKRGDANCDGAVNNADVAALSTIVQQCAVGLCNPCCADAADVNDNGVINAQDVATLQNFVVGGPAPPSPGPFTCGPDPTQDGLACLNQIACASSVIYNLRVWTLEALLVGIGERPSNHRDTAGLAQWRFSPV